MKKDSHTIYVIEMSEKRRKTNDYRGAFFPSCVLLGASSMTVSGDALRQSGAAGAEF